MTIGLTSLSINTQNFALSGYDNYQFKGMSMINGKLYGVKDDGLYLLEGATDNGVAIQSHFLTGQSDLERDYLKTIPLFHADTSGEFDVLVSVDETVHEIPFNGRARLGRGVRGMRIAFGLKNKNGSKLEVRSLEPVVEISKKRALA